MKKLIMILALVAGLAGGFARAEQPAVQPDSPQGKLAPRPLYRDPPFDAPTDPVLCFNDEEKKWFMYYTARRATAENTPGVTWVHGSNIGMAESSDGGATWKYRGTADINYGKDAHPNDYTYWAPEVISHDGTYHMFLSFVPGIFTDWNHPREIVHLTSKDGVKWDTIGSVDLKSERVIDACVIQLPSGTWRMWYKDETKPKPLSYADSTDLKNWEPKGNAVTDFSGEGPKVFHWKGRYWLIADCWANGMRVWSSDDCLNWKLQEEALFGSHGDVVVSGDRAWWFYFGGRRRNVANNTPAAAQASTTDAPSSATGATTNKSPEDYKLVWADEFNKDGQLDQKDWGYETGFVRNQELQWYQPENAVCKDGFLVIEAKKEQRPNPRYVAPATTSATTEEGATADGQRRGGRRRAAGWQNREMIEYTSASVNTRGKHAWLYGRFEIRAKIDVREGSWPAFWTLGTQGRWPANGEVDIMEYYRQMVLANVAWAGETASGNRITWNTKRMPLSSFPNDWAENFHTWRMDWDEDSIKLYLDGAQVNSQDLSKTINAPAQDGSAGQAPENPFHAPVYILLNQAIGGMQGGDPAATEFPVRFVVDYVRVWQTPSQLAKATTTSGATEAPAINAPSSAPPARQSRGRTTAINVVELSVINGKLVAGDPEQPTYIDLKPVRENEN